MKHCKKLFEFIFFALSAIQCNEELYDDGETKRPQQI